MPEKLRIRVVNAQSLDRKESSKPKVIVEYHWNRIFAASLIIVALLAGLIWGGVHLFERSQDKPPVLIEQAAQPAETISPTHADSVPEPSKPKDSAKAVTGTQTESVAFPLAQASSKSVAESSDDLAVAILSGNIKRVQLTSGVKDGAPVDSIGQTIPMNAKGLIRVYLFMETEGLKGKVLFHDWYWKGKRIAHARIPIKRDANIAASSKFIDRIMMGPWEVKVVDASSRVLAKAAFAVQ
ncbi:MAG: DUF2914 domain-containing protein [Proteobacteria bacterium]|nr:DUF2914 domain-containing protein [Pseudomonadota bacterium]